MIIAFTRNVSSEHIDKRLAKMRKQFVVSEQVPLEFVDIERIGYREACEVAFNAQSIYGSIETSSATACIAITSFWNGTPGKR